MKGMYNIVLIAAMMAVIVIFSATFSFTIGGTAKLLDVVKVTHLAKMENAVKAAPSYLSPALEYAVHQACEDALTSGFNYIGSDAIDTAAFTEVIRKGVLAQLKRYTDNGFYFGGEYATLSEIKDIDMVIQNDFITIGAEGGIKAAITKTAEGDETQNGGSPAGNPSEKQSKKAIKRETISVSQTVMVGRKVRTACLALFEEMQEMAGRVQQDIDISAVLLALDDQFTLAGGATLTVSDERLCQEAAEERKAEFEASAEKIEAEEDIRRLAVQKEDSGLFRLEAEPVISGKFTPVFGSGKCEVHAQMDVQVQLKLAGVSSPYNEPVPVKDTDGRLKFKPLAARTTVSRK